MLIPVLLFALGLVLLIKGGDWFVDGATGIAERFHVPEIIIGATVVSIGTTLPEVMVSATSALTGHGEIAYGNAIGSIICNTALIAALTVAIRPGPVDTKALKTPVLLGILLLAIFVVYLVVTVRQGFKNPAEAAAEEAGAVEEEAAKNSMVKDILLLVIGAALVAVGADLLVDNGTLIAQALGVPESVIALTFVALGTSLPELVTAITSLAKGHGSLSLGNVIGANIFNLVLVSGASMTLAPFRIPQSSTLFGVNSSLVLDVPLMLFVMALLTLPALKTKKLSRCQGIVLLILYAAFCGIQFSM